MAFVVFFTLPWTRAWARFFTLHVGWHVVCKVLADVAEKKKLSPETRSKINKNILENCIGSRLPVEVADFP